MKPTQLTELIANIRKTFVSFFSILMFVALGVGIFLGISWAAPALQGAADDLYDEGAFHDFQVQFSYGLTSDDLEKLADVEGVTLVEPARQSFQQVALDGRDYTAKVQAIGSEIDVPLVVEGELPQQVGEIALLASAAKELGVGVGDAVEFSEDAGGSDGEGGSGDADGMKYLTNGAFTVTALVNSPEYLANSSATYGVSNTPSGKIDLVAFALPEAFDAEAFQDGYPVVNVRCDGLRGAGTFSDDYERAADDVKARISELGDGLSRNRYQELHDSAKADVDDAERKLDNAKGELAQKERELGDARAQVRSSESELDAAHSRLVSSRADLDAKRAELEEKSIELQAKQRELDAGVAKAEKEKAKTIAELQDSEKMLELYLAEHPDDAETAALLAEQKEAEAEVAAMKIDDVEYSKGGKTIGQARSALADAQAELSAGRAALDQAEAELQAGWGEYYEGQAKLEQARDDIAEGERKLEDAQGEIGENEGKVADAKESLDQMKSRNWVVSARSDGAAASEVSVFSGVTDNLSYSMAALFVIVGLLVSYSAVSRIVHEQITQIGTKKALGLREREITLSFLAYSALAVVAGAVVGTAVGVTLVEGIIGHVLGGMFAMGDYPPYFGLPLFLVVTALELVLVLGATWLACHSILREHAVELLKGEKPPEAKTRFYEKWALWDRLPLFTQTIVNNCVNDKRRVFSTIVGVAGCTALIVTAITLNDDVLASYDRQYQNVYSFNAIAYVDTSTEGAADNVETTLQDVGASTAQVLRKSFVLKQPDGGLATARAIVPESADSLDRVYHVNPVQGAPLDLSADGAWISQAYADHLGAKVGDELAVDAGDGVERRVPILGFYEFWLANYELVMGRDYYERAFDVEFAPNVVLADTGEGTVPDAEAMLAGTPGFGSIADDKASQGGNFQQFASVSRAVVLIYLALAALMAVVVLLNLNVMFIEEKKRDLIVLMINGFSVRDAKRYIYNDTIVLTVIGIAAGLVLGAVAGSATVASVEPSTATFLKGVAWRAVAVGTAGTAVLAFVMSAVALRRIPRFSLTDINKL